MSEERVVKRLYQNTPEGSRSVGRPRLRWMEDVREDLRRMGVTNWRICAHRRGTPSASTATHTDPHQQGDKQDRNTLAPRA